MSSTTSEVRATSTTVSSVASASSSASRGRRRGRSRDDRSVPRRYDDDDDDDDEERSWASARTSTTQTPPVAEKGSSLGSVGEVDDVATLWTLRYRDAALSAFWSESFDAASTWRGVRWSDGRARRLCLDGCAGLVELPSAVGRLDGLEQLTLRNCGDLTTLPADALGELAGLTCLNLSGCRSLTELPETLLTLPRLRQLNLNHCKSLQALPEELGQLRSSLRELKLSHCESLTELPDSVGELVDLTELKLGRCKQLEELPTTVGNLTRLVALNLTDCRRLTSLPGELSCLRENLTSLDLTACDSLRELPWAVGEITSLTQLYLTDCRRLTFLPDSLCDLRNLTHLGLRHCRGLTRLPERLGDLHSLAKLNLDHCSSLRRLPLSLGAADALRHLFTKNCDAMVLPPEEVRRRGARDCVGLLRDLDRVLRGDLGGVPAEARRALADVVVIEPAFEERLREAVDLAPRLARWSVPGSSDETLMDAACPECRRGMRRGLHFLGRYEVDRRPPLHLSPTTAVLAATEWPPTEPPFEDPPPPLTVDDDVRSGGAGSHDTDDTALTSNAHLRHRRRREDDASARPPPSLRRALRTSFSVDGVVAELRSRRHNVNNSKHLIGLVAVHADSATVSPKDLARVERAAADAGVSFLRRPGLDGRARRAVRSRADRTAVAPPAPFVLVAPLADRSLTSALERERVGPDELGLVRKIGTDLCHALGALHARGRVHGDLTPSNVAHALFSWALLDLENSVRVGERYGTAKRPSTGYCPPEMARVLLGRDDDDDDDDDDRDRDSRTRDSDDDSGYFTDARSVVSQKSRVSFAPTNDEYDLEDHDDHASTTSTPKNLTTNVKKDPPVSILRTSAASRATVTTPPTNITTTPPTTTTTTTSPTTTTNNNDNNNNDNTVTTTHNNASPDLSRYVARVSYDLWSLGVVLFRLAFGRALWETDDRDDLVSEDDLRALADWNRETCRSFLLRLFRSSQDDAPRQDDDALDASLRSANTADVRERDMGALCNLVAMLLEPDPDTRERNFFDARESVADMVLRHPFFRPHVAIDVPGDASVSTSVASSSVPAGRGRSRWGRSLRRLGRRASSLRSRSRGRSREGRSRERDTDRLAAGSTISSRSDGYATAREAGPELVFASSSSRPFAPTTDTRSRTSDGPPSRDADESVSSVSFQPPLPSPPPSSSSRDRAGRGAARRGVPGTTEDVLVSDVDEDLCASSDAGDEVWFLRSAHCFAGLPFFRRRRRW